jgi:hypothetical protein
MGYACLFGEYIHNEFNCGIRVEKLNMYIMNERRKKGIFLKKEEKKTATVVKKEKIPKE